MKRATANRINDEIQKEAAKVAAGDNVGTALARMFTPAGTIRQPGAKLQALLLQQAIARDRAIRQHAAEHPELYAERSTR
jgi:hypothetical protein